MSFNSMKNLGADMILGDVVAKSITCQTISVLDPDDPDNPTDLTVETITANTGNFQVINVTNLNVSDPDDVVIPADLNVSSITATTGNIENLTSNNFIATSGSVSSSFASNSITSQNIEASNIVVNEKFNVSNNCMIINDTNIDSNIPLLGNPGSITVGQYLSEIYPDSEAVHTLQQLAAGDNYSQSLIMTAGGSYADTRRVSMQAFDSYLNNSLDLYVNPLGGDLRTGGKLYVNDNCLITNSSNSDDNTTLLGNPGAITVGAYLSELYPDSEAVHALQQLTSGDNNSQSILLSSGDSYADTRRNVIQSFDSFLNEPLDLYLNPLGGNVVTDNLTFSNSDMAVQAQPLSSSAIPNMEILFYHLTGTSEQSTITVSLVNNINATSNYAVFPSLYFGQTSGSSGTYGPFNSFFNINVSCFTSTEFRANIQKGSGDNANVYIQFLVIYDMVGTDFPKNY